MTWRGTLAGVMAVAVILVACDAVPRADRVLHVSAASSLTTAFSDMAVAFESANPGVDVVLNFAASSLLREQILSGAPVGVFASADQRNMEAVQGEDMVVGEPVVFALNHMEIAVPWDNPGDVVGLADFGRPELLIGLCDAGVPCGEQARDVLAKAGITPQVDTNEPNVRSLLTKISSGELDAGIVYATDVLSSSGEAKGIEIPPEDNVTAKYPIVTLRGGGAAAAAFVEFVLSPAGREVLADHGFGTP